MSSTADVFSTRGCFSENCVTLSRFSLDTTENHYCNNAISNEDRISKLNNLSPQISISIILFYQDYPVEEVLLDLTKEA